MIEEIQDVVRRDSDCVGIFRKRLGAAEADLDRRVLVRLR